MPEKKMLKKSTWFKTKRTSQQNGRTKSVKKMTCKTSFLSCAKGTNLYIQMSILDIWKNPK